MITIRINKQPVQIPTYKELTVKQYKELLPFISDTGKMNYIRYICVVTGRDYQETIRTVVKGLQSLGKFLGNFMFVAGDKDLADGIHWFENHTPEMLVKHQGKIIDLRGFDPKAVGYRILLEEFLGTQPSYLELYLFMAACVIQSGFDYEDTIKIKEELEYKNAWQYISLGAFFFYRWKRSENKGSRFLRLLKKVISMSMKQTSAGLELIDLKSTQR